MQSPSRAQGRNSAPLGKIRHRLPATRLDMSCGHQQALGCRIPAKEPLTAAGCNNFPPNPLLLVLEVGDKQDIHSPKHSLLSLSYIHGAAEHEIPEPSSLKEETLPPTSFSLRDLRQKAFSAAPREMFHFPHMLPEKESLDLTLRTTHPFSNQTESPCSGPSIRQRPATRV